MIAAGAWWTFDLLGRTDWNSWLRWLVLLSGAGAVAVALTPAGILRRAALVIAPLTALTLLAGPTAYAVQTASTAHTGAIPSAGPASVGFGGGAPGGGVAGTGPGPAASRRPGGAASAAAKAVRAVRAGGRRTRRRRQHRRCRPGRAAAGGAGGGGGGGAVASAARAPCRAALKTAFASNAEQVHVGRRDDQ